MPIESLDKNDHENKKIFSSISLLAKKIPVIMLTARSFDIGEDIKGQLDISECLSKPFSPKELLRCIEDVLFSTAANVEA